MPSQSLHPAVKSYAEEYERGLIGRREFLARATALGVTTAAAYGAIGLSQPALAQTAPRKGGTLRISMETRPVTDPRSWDNLEIANFARGWLDWLTVHARDGSVQGSLCESWEVNDTADQYTLHLRKSVTWTNGDAFTAEDVMHNFVRWGDQTEPTNSMPSRIASLIDPETKKLRDGAVEIVDEHTLILRPHTSDITLMAAVTDYPAAIVHRSYQGEDIVQNPIGTGAYRPIVNEVSQRQILERIPDREYWRPGGWLDRIEFIDYGTEQTNIVAAAEAGDIDLTFRTDAEFVALMDRLGWQRSEMPTASTIVVRFNQNNAPYDNRDVRRALQMAVDNNVLLTLGIDGQGIPAENHHVCPLHPEYAELPPIVPDPAGALDLLKSTGHADTEFELVSIDSEWQSNTCDAVAAQLRDAGIKVKRTVLPSSTYWNSWLEFPFSATEWGPRPLGVQILALAYLSNAAWNESAFRNAEFDELLTQAMSIADTDKRREIMARIQKLMQDEGVIIQPFWRSAINHSNGKLVNADVHQFFLINVHDIYFKE